MIKLSNPATPSSSSSSSPSSSSLTPTSPILPPSPFLTSALLTSCRSLSLKSLSSSLLLSSLLNQTHPPTTSTFNKYLLIHYHSLTSTSTSRLDSQLHSFISQLLKSDTNPTGGINKILEVIDTLPEDAYMEEGGEYEEIHRPKNTTSSVTALRILYLMLHLGPPNALPDLQTYSLVFKILEMNNHCRTSLALLNNLSNYIPPPPSLEFHKRSSPSYGFIPPTPNIYFTVLLSLCKVPGQSSSALNLLLQMRKTLTPPSPRHYTCVIRSFGRDNLPLDATILLWNTMPLHNLPPDKYTYEATIRACSTFSTYPRTEVPHMHKHFEVSERPELKTAFQILKEADENVSPTLKSYECILEACCRLPNPTDPEYSFSLNVSKETFKLWSKTSLPVGRVVSTFKFYLIRYYVDEIMGGDKWPTSGISGELGSCLEGVDEKRKGVILEEFRDKGMVENFRRRRRKEERRLRKERENTEKILRERLGGDNLNGVELEDFGEEDWRDGIEYDISFDDEFEDMPSESSRDKDEKDRNESWW
ncbi:hypothetical protein TL16_g02964 [Triparma laevis f. inornata]|uniref:Pentatricopeptide repeat-containing protein n=1 Tax=Triparma laevis f. inornata TaxID=1714386 RepID=A0A9W6ZSY9_9STRA|nr:hypothetical protein TL16_g02964 [Triparma laevis f. inornata]